MLLIYQCLKLRGYFRIISGYGSNSKDLFLHQCATLSSMDSLKAVTCQCIFLTDTLPPNSKVLLTSLMRLPPTETTIVHGKTSAALVEGRAPFCVLPIRYLALQQLLHALH